jgi:hypothetical protein
VKFKARRRGRWPVTCCGWRMVRAATGRWGAGPRQGEQRSPEATGDGDRGAAAVVGGRRLVGGGRSRGRAGAVG